MAKKETYDIDESYGWLMATAAQQLRHRLTEKFGETGLDISAEQWTVMLRLWNEDGISQQFLANRIRRSKVAVFKLIEGLEKKGLVIRKPHPDDGRSKQVFLTPAGKEIQGTMNRAAKENLAEAAQGVTENELEIFKDVLRRLIINMCN